MAISHGRWRRNLVLILSCEKYCLEVPLCWWWRWEGGSCGGGGKGGGCGGGWKSCGGGGCGGGGVGVRCEGVVMVTVWTLVSQDVARKMPGCYMKNLIFRQMDGTRHVSISVL